MVTAGAMCGFWMCFNEMQNLRRDLDAEIAKRTSVEFSGVQHLQNPANHSDSTNFDQAVFSYKEFRHSLKTELEFGSDDDDENAANDDDFNEEEKLTRVKRRARRKSAYYKEGSEPQDMVWLTSYSRIPVSSETPSMVGLSVQMKADLRKKLQPGVIRATEFLPLFSFWNVKM